MEAGTVIGGRYRLTGVLGRGGMGTVYAAEQLETAERVAIKVLHAELRDSPEIRSRFEREAHTSGFLQHPNVVAVHEMGSTEDGALYLVMELLEGCSVADLLESDGTLHPRRALVLLRQTLLGLRHAHQHGLVHRDLKPENVMVERSGAPGREHELVRVLDFGVVKILSEVARGFGWDTLTRTGMTFGTPGYMAPEQALGRDVDARADLYSAGVILFEMLTGRRPFESDDPIALLRMQVGTPPPALAEAAPGAPFCTAPMCELVARALVKKPAARYADAREMIAAVDAAFVSIDHLPA